LKAAFGTTSKGDKSTKAINERKKGVRNEDTK
jgi:hypothetical protein